MCKNKKNIYTNVIEKIIMILGWRRFRYKLKVKLQISKNNGFSEAYSASPCTQYSVSFDCDITSK